MARKSTRRVDNVVHVDFGHPNQRHINILDIPSLPADHPIFQHPSWGPEAYAVSEQDEIDMANEKKDKDS